MELLAGLANGFMELFKAGAETFAGWVAGIIPLIVVLMTAVSAVIKLIGEERVQSLAQKATKNIITRYTILPILSVLFLGNPMCYSFGRFVEEKHKPAFYDATVSFLHPVTGLFPHANGGELFVYMGIAAGITKLGLPLGDLAVRYFLVGIIIIFIRGIVTEKIYTSMKAKAK
ncbi:eii-gut: pts system glucitol/sorbitol-specific iic component [Lucifera butyrica]|uniref:Eii-gut: pts system glucitol/sorbitol-specific iic component n=1 Tax=Lucifera butyrica TaxID=1351585 RepID=A0A498RDK3_9FIRM|nr:PTS glucitol/sorbitol transporter subunit IIC [Lucifera butyrica]VBB07288.1 eii-gut: pts system glucitol/sorbitol-specific iic component [Lucifera butyrica]